MNQKHFYLVPAGQVSHHMHLVLVFYLVPGVPSYALLVFYGMLSDSMALPVVFAFAALGSTGVYGEDEVDYAQYRHWIGLGRRMEVFFFGSIGRMQRTQSMI